MPWTPTSLLAMNSSVSSMPRPDCLVALRKVTAAWSAEDFLVLLVGEQGAQGCVLAPIGNPHAGLPHAGNAGKGAANHGREPDQLEHERRRFRPPNLGTQPGEMAAGDMAALMGDDPDHLIGRLGVHQHAGMNEHVMPVDDEGVEGAVVDEMDADVLRAEAGGGEDRLGVDADQRFRFGIADEPGSVHRGRGDQSGREPADESRAEPPGGGIDPGLGQKRHGSA